MAIEIKDLGRVPIDGASPSGFDAKYEPEYLEILGEIDKLSSPTSGSSISWENVLNQGCLVLSQKSKDFVVCAYLGIALQKLRGLQGLYETLDLFKSFFENFWQHSFPPVARIRRRQNAFEWWYEKAVADLKAMHDVPPLESDFAQSLSDLLADVDAAAGSLMPDIMPLRDMKELLSRLPVQAPKKEPEPKEPLPEEKEEAATPPPPETAAPAPAPKTEPEPQKAPPAPETSSVPQAEAKPAPKPEPAPEPAPEPVQNAVPAQNSPQPSQAPSSPSQQSASVPQQAAPARVPVQRAAPPEGSSPLLLCGWKQTPALAAPSEETNQAQKAFADAALSYAFALERDDPRNPFGWQISRIALWSKIRELPPAENRTTRILPPDENLSNSVRRLFEGKKYLKAAMEAESLFSSSIFCLDAQRVAVQSLEALGGEYACAHAIASEEALRFIQRLPGVQELCFSDGTPFADEATKEWIATLEEAAMPLAAAPSVPPVSLSSSGAGGQDQGRIEALKGQALQIASQGSVQGALALFENIGFVSATESTQAQIARTEILVLSKEAELARVAADYLLEEVDRWNMERVNPALATEAFVAARNAYTLSKDSKALDAQRRLARICPSKAVGWRHKTP